MRSLQLNSLTTLLISFPSGGSLASHLGPRHQCCTYLRMYVERSYHVKLLPLAPMASFLNEDWHPAGEAGESQTYQV